MSAFPIYLSNLSLGAPLKVAQILAKCPRKFQELLMSQLPTGETRRAFLRDLMKAAAAVGLAPLAPKLPDDPLAFLGPKEYRQKMILNILAKAPGAFQQSYSALTDGSWRKANPGRALMYKASQPYDVNSLEQAVINSKPNRGLAILKSLLRGKPSQYDLRALEDARHISVILSNEHFQTFGSSGSPLSNREIGFIRQMFGVEDLPIGENLLQGTMTKALKPAYEQLPPSYKRDTVLHKYDPNRYPRPKEDNEIEEPQRLANNASPRFLSDLNLFTHPAWTEGEQGRAQEFMRETIHARPNPRVSSGLQHID